MTEVLTLHRGGIERTPVTAHAEPSKALFKVDPLCDGERPMDGVQLRMSIGFAVIPYVSPKKQTRIGHDIPFPFLL